MVLFYQQNGTATQQLPAGYNLFYIVDNTTASSSLDRYSYPGDSIQYKLDSLCVELYDTFRRLIFPSEEEYYRFQKIQPQWISRAGIDSDFNMSKEQLIDCFSTPIDKRMKELGCDDDTLLKIFHDIDNQKYKYAYMTDCQNLISTLQELLCGCQSSFIGFYKQLCTLPQENKLDSIFWQSGADVRMVFSFLYSLIIQLYSSFDILTKIFYEQENLQSCDTAYVKLASRKIIFGDKKSLKIDISGTVFEKCRSISIVENLRNELIHNATWEMVPKIFIITENNEIHARNVLLPDFTNEGTIVTYKNRKRFFSDKKTVNDELPKLFFDILHRIQTTLQKLLSASN